MLNPFKKTRFFALMLIALVADSSRAEKPDFNYEKEIDQRAPFDKAMLDFPFMSESEFKTAKTEVKKASDEFAKGEQRFIARSESLSEGQMSPQLRAKRDEYLGLANPEALDQFLAKLDREYDTYPTDLKLFAAMAIPLRSLRGVIWRMIPYVKDTPAAHSFLLSGVQQWAASMKVYFPSRESGVAFDYVSQPFAVGSAPVMQFYSDLDVQVFLSNDLFKGIEKAATRVQAIKIDPKQPIVLDNRLFYGMATFTDDLERFRSVGSAEKSLLMANYHGSLATIAFNRAYVLDGALKLSKQLGYLMGIDGFKLPLKMVEGVTAEDRVGVIRKKEFAKFGTLMPKYGASWTKLSLYHTRASARYMSIAYNDLKNKSHSTTTLIDPATVIPGMRQSDLTLENLEAIIKGPTSVRSAMTGEVVTIDLPAYFENPPSDLKNLLPTQFDQSKNPSVYVAGKSIEYRNYFRGRPTGWNVGAFQKYVPSIRSNSDVPTAARVLSQSFGGGWVMGPLALAVQ